MKWLIGAVGGFFISILSWLTKKIGIKGILLFFIIPVFTAFVVFLNAFAIFAILYVMKIWNLIKEYIPKMMDYSSASGSFGGLSNSTIISSLMEFIHVSGLAGALSTSIPLFISILSLYFVIQLYKLLVYVYRNIGAIISTLLTLMAQ